MLRASPLQPDDEQSRQDPEHDQLARPRIGDPGQPAAEEEDPGAERDQMDDADEVVDGRMAEAPVVIAVEAVHCRQQHPGRQAQEEDGELVHGPRTGPVGAEPENEYAREERCRQSGRVCNNERAANQRPTAPRRLPHLGGRERSREVLGCRGRGPGDTRTHDRRHGCPRVGRLAQAVLVHGQSH